VADLLDRHGAVRTERAAPLPGPRRPLSERMRRTLIAVGSVLAAGGVLGGAVAVSTTGHEAPLGRTPGGLFDRPDPGPSAAGDAAGAPVNGLELPAAAGAPAGRTGSTAAPGGVPQPRVAVGPADAPSASTAPTIVVPEQQQGGAAGGRTADRSAPVPTAARAVVPAAPSAAPVAAGVDSAARSGASAAPTAPSGAGGSGTGLLGGVTKAVGDLFHS
jgi:hypothetical protein